MRACYNIMRAKANGRQASVRRAGVYGGLMRLTCPNCKAQYEVEESVIPDEGRDVQCSSCGHTWYQYPISVALQMRAAELEDDDDDDEDEGGDPPPASPVPVRQIDRSVMDLLRQEAEREMGERRGAASGLESQPDLGLTARPSRPVLPASAGRERPARGGARSGEDTAPAGDGDQGGARSRLDMLPDIEELSSTLETRREPRKPATNGEELADEAPRDDRRGLLRGLSLVVIIVGILFGLYVLAPVIAAQVPALEDAMTGYVAMVDALRRLVAGWVAGVTGAAGG